MKRKVTLREAKKAKGDVVALQCLNLARLNYVPQNSLPSVLQLEWATERSSWEIMRPENSGHLSLTHSAAYLLAPLAGMREWPGLQLLCLPLRSSFSMSDSRARFSSISKGWDFCRSPHH